MAINVELLKKTLEAIKANPDHWEQETWHCGTSHCFAGFAELLSLGLPIDSEECDLRDSPSVYNEVKWQWNTRDNAMKALGLNDSFDSYDKHLFSAFHTLEDLTKMVAHLSEYGSLDDYYDDGDDNEDSEGWSDEDNEDDDEDSGFKPNVGLLPLS